MGIETASIGLPETRRLMLISPSRIAQYAACLIDDASGRGGAIPASWAMAIMSASVMARSLPLTVMACSPFVPGLVARS